MIEVCVAQPKEKKEKTKKKAKGEKAEKKEGEKLKKEGEKSKTEGEKSKTGYAKEFPVDDTLASFVGSPVCSRTTVWSFLLPFL